MTVNYVINLVRPQALYPTITPNCSTACWKLKLRVTQLKTMTKISLLFAQYVRFLFAVRQNRRFSPKLSKPTDTTGVLPILTIRGRG